MIIFDIDQTISPADRDYEWLVPHETETAWSFEIGIPSYVLEFLRNRDDIALLSTWGEKASEVSTAFGFKADILVLKEGTYGIEGKFEIVKNLNNVTAWIDDHMTAAMKKELEKKGILAIKPINGVISEKQLAKLVSI
jgi:hypothetical protein